MKSNLFGGFGAGLFVPPNTIDFSTVFDDFAAKLVENLPVVATVAALLVLYIPLVILCRRYDVKDKLKVGNDHVTMVVIVCDQYHRFVFSG